MRKKILNCIEKTARKNKKIIFIGSDLGVGVLDNFKKKNPDRFFMEGVSEQHIVGMAAGMAMEGFIPYVNTIATFLTRRCFEQNILDLGLHNSKVRLIANGGGYVYAPLGPTHLAFEDLAIMRTIPNMTIFCPADSNEIQQLFDLSINHEGPIYFRLAKGFDEIVTSLKAKYQIGKGILYGKHGDFLVCTTGITLQMALKAKSILETMGIPISIFHSHTIKPFDEKQFIGLTKKFNNIITIEEHSCIGGLASICSEIIVQKNLKFKGIFKSIALPDSFPIGYGSQNSLLEKYGISCDYLVKSVQSIYEKK